MKKDSRGGMVAMVHPMDLFNPRIGAFIEIDCQLDVIAKTPFRSRRLAVLRARDSDAYQQ
jgi:hypothetical protein